VSVPAGVASEPKWTVRALLAWSREWLAKKGVENPRLDAELLLAHALRLPRIRLYIEHDKPLEPDELARFKALILRRAEREPVAYLLGSKEFYGRAFTVDRRAFIPRPETELLVQAVLAGLGGADESDVVGAPTNPPLASGDAGGGEMVATPTDLGPARPPAPRVLDLCAGSGAAGVTLAAERPSLEVDLVELSPETAVVARQNAEAHAPGRARVLVGDLFAPLAPGTRYAAIAANPPYIPVREKARLAPEIARHEPGLALFAGEDGLEVIRRIVGAAPRWLEPGGLLALELDPAQADEAVRLCALAGLAGARVERDLAGLLRILVARAPQSERARGDGDGVRDGCKE